jgi:hypothetical protein
MGGSQGFVFRNITEACEAREHGGDSSQYHQVEGAIMQAKEWMRTSGRCNPVEHAVTKQHEDHVWFEDRWMVASLCDE